MSNIREETLLQYWTTCQTNIAFYTYILEIIILLINIDRQTHTYMHTHVHTHTVELF